ILCRCERIRTLRHRDRGRSNVRHMTWVGVVFATSLLALLGVLSGGAGAQTRTPPKVTAPHKARPNAAPKGPGESVAQQRLRKRGYLVADEKALADAKGIAPPPLRSRLTAGGPLVP